MGYELTQQAYAQNVGTTPTNYPWVDTRNPNANDIYYPIGKFWINTANQTLWYLNSQNTTSGFLQSLWIEIAAGTGVLSTLTGDDGLVVIPTLDNINIDGITVANATHAKPVFTKKGAVSELDIDVQVAGAFGSSNINNAGLASFNNTEFSVDANGFVSLIGGGAAIEKVNLQTGTTPIVPLLGAITFNGAVVAAGTNPVRTDGTGANTMALEVQISQAIASTDATKIGLSAFNSSQFTVDANGFVSLIGGGAAIDSVQVDTFTAPGTNPVLPTAAGLITVTGGQVAAGTTTNVIRTDSLAANTYTIEIQRSQAVASSTIGDNGVCHFDNTQFSVDANGFVQMIGGSPYISLTPYIVGQPGDAHAGFTTIQSAITQAIADGASTANPKNIYVKPGTYTENITTADGINIIGFVPTTANGGNDVFPTSILAGTVTYASGTASFVNFQFKLATGNIFNISGGVLSLIGCQVFPHTSGSTFVFSVASTKEITISNSAFSSGGTGKFLSTDGSNMLVNFRSAKSIYFYENTSTISGATASLQMQHALDGITNQFSMDCGGPWSFEINQSTIVGQTVTPFITTTANSTNPNNILISSCIIQANSTFLDLTLGTTPNIGIDLCTGANIVVLYPANALRTGDFYLTQSLTQGDQSTALTFQNTVTGWNGATWQMKQSFLQTLAATPQTLISIPVAAGTSITLQGQITAANAAHSDITGGNFLVTADGTAAAIIGSAVINLNASSTGTFTASFSAGNLLIQVTAPSAAAYNWASTYQFQKMLTNA